MNSAFRKVRVRAQLLGKFTHMNKSEEVKKSK
jgi:hypothetical protein